MTKRQDLTCDNVSHQGMMGQMWRRNCDFQEALIRSASREATGTIFPVLSLSRFEIKPTNYQSQVGHPLYQWAISSNNNWDTRVTNGCNSSSDTCGEFVRLLKRSVDVQVIWVDTVLLVLKKNRFIFSLNQTWRKDCLTRSQSRCAQTQQNSLNIVFLYPLLIKYARSPYLADKDDGCATRKEGIRSVTTVWNVANLDTVCRKPSWDSVN